jgi:hypothetical protein
LDTVLSETACAPNQIILMEDCGPRYNTVENWMFLA